jgi:putative transposase
MATYTELTQAGVTTRTAATLTGVPRSTATRPAAVPVLEPAARRVPANRLSAAERLEILAVLDAPRFVDLPPIQIWAQLLDEGIYLCSISTLYRILAEHAQLVERRRIARHPARTVPELVATGPGQVYSWDITKLAGPAKGIYYDAYVMIDIYSRYIVGARVHPHESGQLAADMMAQVFGLHGAPQVVHADRGTSMTSKSVAQLLVDLDVTRSHSRPQVSNDNAFSEAAFKTLKYCPAFPDYFDDIDHARAFCKEFFDYYNHEHYHSGLGLHTPASVHFGTAETIRADRAEVLTAAYARNPERFNRRPEPPKLPTVAWINPPSDPTQLQNN